MQPAGRGMMRIQTAYGLSPRDHGARGARERAAIELELLADDRPFGWDDAGCQDCGSSTCRGNPD